MTFIKSPSAARRRSTGQAMVEMALVLPILLMILFGIIDMGWLLFRWVSLHSAAREGLRIAAMNSPGPSGADTAPMIKGVIVRSGVGLNLTSSAIRLQALTQAADLTITGGQPRINLEVTVNHRFFGSMAWIGQDSMTIQAVYQSAVATWPGNDAINFTSDI